MRQRRLRSCAGLGVGAQPQSGHRAAPSVALWGVGVARSHLGVLSVKCKSARGLLHLCVNRYVAFMAAILILCFFWNSRLPCSLKTRAASFCRLQCRSCRSPVPTLGTLPTPLTPSLPRIFPSAGLWDGNVHIVCMNSMQLSNTDCLNGSRTQGPTGTHSADDGWVARGRSPVTVLARGH